MHRPGAFENAQITESSGLVRSLRHAGLLWTINDGGGPGSGRLFAVDAGGGDLGSWRVQSGLVDWEGLAVARIGGTPHLFIGDFGDNRRTRRECVVYGFPEPAMVAPGTAGPDQQPSFVLRFRFEGGARNCEAFAIDDREGRIYLVDKNPDGPPVLYSLPLGASPRAVATARRIGPIGLAASTGASGFGNLVRGVVFGDQITGMDFDASGRRAALLTYSRVLLYEKGAGESWSVALQRAPRAVSHRGFYQAEAIAFTSSGGLLGSSEGATRALREISAGSR